MSKLASVDLASGIDYEKYQVKKEKLQKKLGNLQAKLRKQNRGLVLVFEGWDAAGKGGAIKRLTNELDPRYFKIHPVAAPTKLELRHHYLWRFARSIEPYGHVTIFDRSWYGRVMVERVEGFASEREWKQAYDEINDFEKHLTNSGYIMIKFFLHLSDDEQLARFKARELNIYKRWKLTEEDWRNREKRPQYEAAIEEMLDKTNYIPWNVVAAEQKHYARISVMETVKDVLSKEL